MIASNWLQERVHGGREGGACLPRGRAQREARARTPGGDRRARSARRVGATASTSAVSRKCTSSNDHCCGHVVEKHPGERCLGDKAATGSRGEHCLIET